MSSSPPSPLKSSFWSLSRLKSRFRVHSLESTEKDHSPSPQSPDIFEDAVETQKDGFYRYSESLLEEKTRTRMAERSSAGKDSSGKDSLLPPGQGSGCSTTDSSQSNRRRSRPYRVSSNEWVQAVPPNTLRYSLSPSPKVMSLNGLNHDEWVNGFQDVFKIFFTIYALAKIMQVCFLGYGSDLDSAPQGLSYWIQRAETEIRTDSLAELIEIVENLFYTLYARIMLELAGTELCSLFPITERPVRSKSLYYLPSPSRLHRIFLAFKDILDCPDICENLHLELMTQYLESYIRRLICSDARKGRPGSGDTLGYYQHALAIARDRESDFRKKWDSLMECFADFPPQTITSLSDKYLTVLPRAIPTIETATSDLPFVNLKMLSPESWDQIMIEEHRYNALAQLESRTVGEYRRMDPNCNLLEELKYHRCVCSSICSCAKDCTYDTERACPCSEWQMHLQLVTNRKTAGPHDFATRVNTIALACFQGLNFLKKEISDHDLIMEIQSIFKVIELEVQKERSNGKLAPRPDAAP